MSIDFSCLRQILFIIFLLVYYSNETTAQISKGNFLVGGEGGFSLNENEIDLDGNIIANNESFIRLAPNIGYFLVANLAFGVIIDIQLKNSNNSFGSTNSEKIYSAGPFIRYYFLKKGRVNMFIQSAYTIGKGDYTFSSDPVEAFGELNQSENKHNIDLSGYALKTGLAFFLSRNVSLELSLRYHNSTENRESRYLRFANGVVEEFEGIQTTKNTGLSFGVGFQIHLGQPS